jgi:site-specific DNA-methyltransferase (adenine-specific)
VAELFLGDRVALHAGDCRDFMARLPPGSIDACVCDPPYHLHATLPRFAKTGGADRAVSRAASFGRHGRGFMGKAWDGGDIAFKVRTWRAVYRLLKPGAYLIAFSSTRTFGRMQVAIEEAGFITHPFIAWIFGQGFPKAHRVVASGLTDLDRATQGWDGWRYGTQSLKPAIEPIYVGQKPFEDGLTGTENVIKHGTGALNIDGCRVPADDQEALARNWDRETTNDIRGGQYTNGRSGGVARTTEAGDGRWPANVVHDGSAEVVALFPDSNGSLIEKPCDREFKAFADGGLGGPRGPRGFGDTGSAARFFYSAKADTDHRIGSAHPTVKPLDLVRWLVRLVTPPGGLVLDPFAGTGTTGEAAWHEGLRATLIEADPQSQADIRRRMALVHAGPVERNTESAKARDRQLDPLPLFLDRNAKPEADGGGMPFGGQSV